MDPILNVNQSKTISLNREVGAKPHSFCQRIKEEHVFQVFIILKAYWVKRRDALNSFVKLNSSKEIVIANFPKEDGEFKRNFKCP